MTKTPTRSQVDVGSTPARRAVALAVGSVNTATSPAKDSTGPTPLFAPPAPSARRLLVASPRRPNSSSRATTSPRLLLRRVGVPPPVSCPALSTLLLTETRVDATLPQAADSAAPAAVSEVTGSSTSSSSSPDPALQTASAPGKSLRLLFLTSLPIDGSS